MGFNCEGMEWGKKKTKKQNCKQTEGSVTVSESWCFSVRSVSPVYLLGNLLPLLDFGEAVLANKL